MLNYRSPLIKYYNHFVKVKAIQPLHYGIFFPKTPQIYIAFIFSAF